MSVLLKLLLLYHFQHGEPCSSADRVAAKGVEVAAASEDLCNLGSRHHCTERDPITNALQSRPDQSVRELRYVLSQKMLPWKEYTSEDI